MGNSNWLDPQLGNANIQSSGTAFPKRSILNFMGFAVADDEANDRTNVTNPGGAGGGGFQAQNNGSTIAGSPFSTLNLRGLVGSNGGAGILNLDPTGQVAVSRVTASGAQTVSLSRDSLVLVKNATTAVTIANGGWFDGMLVCVQAQVNPSAITIGAAGATINGGATVSLTQNSQAYILRYDATNTDFIVLATTPLLAVAGGAAGLITGNLFGYALAVLVGTNQVNATYRDCNSGDDTVYVGQNSTGGGLSTKIKLGRVGHTDLFRYAAKDTWAGGTSGSADPGLLPSVVELRNSVIVPAGTTNLQIDQYNPIGGIGSVVAYKAKVICQCVSTGITKAASFSATVDYQVTGGTPTIVDSAKIAVGDANSSGCAVSFSGAQTLIVTISDGNSWKVDVLRPYALERG